MQLCTTHTQYKLLLTHCKLAFTQLQLALGEKYCSLAKRQLMLLLLPTFNGVARYWQPREAYSKDTRLRRRECSGFGVSQLVLELVPESARDWPNCYTYTKWHFTVAVFDGERLLRGRFSR